MKNEQSDLAYRHRGERGLRLLSIFRHLLDLKVPGGVIGIETNKFSILIQIRRMEEQSKDQEVPSSIQVQQAEHENPKPPPVRGRLQRKRQEVITVRNWREYLGESLLIIFSVVLALTLTEWFAKLHEEGQMRQILHQLREELVTNREAEADQYQYHRKIIRRIDTALEHPELAQRFITNGRVDLAVLIDSGVMKHDLNEAAWDLAKQNNAFAKLDLGTYDVVADIYANQQRVIKTEDEVGKILLAWESRKPENLRTTLILVSDNFFAWSVERGPRLLALYDKAIEKLKDY